MTAPSSQSVSCRRPQGPHLPQPDPLPTSQSGTGCLNAPFLGFSNIMQTCQPAPGQRYAIQARKAPSRHQMSGRDAMVSGPRGNRRQRDSRSSRRDEPDRQGVEWLHRSDKYGRRRPWLISRGRSVRRSGRRRWTGAALGATTVGSVLSDLGDQVVAKAPFCIAARYHQLKSGLAPHLKRIMEREDARCGGASVPSRPGSTCSSTAPCGGPQNSAMWAKAKQERMWGGRSRVRRGARRRKSPAQQGNVCVGCADGLDDFFSFSPLFLFHSLVAVAQHRTDSAVGQGHCLDRLHAK